MKARLLFALLVLLFTAVPAASFEHTFTWIQSDWQTGEVQGWYLHLRDSPGGVLVDDYDPARRVQIPKESATYNRGLWSYVHEVGPEPTWSRLQGYNTTGPSGLSPFEHEILEPVDPIPEPPVQVSSAVALTVLALLVATRRINTRTGGG